MNKIQAAYLAGVIDGEGCILIVKQPSANTPIKFQYRLVVEITMCDKETIEYISSFTDRPMTSKKIKSGRTAYKIYWRCARATDMLRNILPYLRGKHAQAKVGLEFDAMTPGRGRSYLQSDIPKLDGVVARIKNLKKPEALRC